MTCPICEKPTVAVYRPFCSRRCADVDLGRWLNGAYAVPSTDPDDAEEALDALEDAPPDGTRPH
ncbi:DNA gyrase inhibitor YacG [Jannaschia sp. S6380]|uniref:DNA gyrase inhibitor YacG n=1 Tax=Jannaschia sp. S6380 TaxID=2926408 RepID=UPI001FF39716|nr:DNA gyrase inhibitor YacG [Jannaschia sp. S6380]